MDLNDTLQLFPRVVLLNVYYNLDIKSLFNCSLVSKHFNKLFNSDILWDKLLQDHYSGRYITLIKCHYNVTESRIIYKIFGDLLIVNKMFDLGHTIEELIYLEGLDLQCNQLTELPKEIRSLVNLRHLYLRENYLTGLPKEVGSLVNLQTLDLDSNQLVELPREIGLLTNLEYLYASYNKLTSLPKEIGSLVKLSDLHIDNNKLKCIELPKELKQLTNTNLFI